MDLDDLLGADPPQTDPLSIDDVLGSPVKPTTTTTTKVEGGKEDTTTTTTTTTTTNTTAAEGLTEGVAIPKLRRPPPFGPLPPRVHPVQLPHFKDPPPHVKPYVTNACYYANQVTLIQPDGSRVRRGIVINDSHIYIMTPEAQVERAVPLLELDALYLQDIPTAKVLGMTKELQTHMLLQLRDPPDVQMAFAHGDTLPTPDAVLSALLQSHNLDLPVIRAAVNSAIDIRRLAAAGVADTTARQTCAATHTHRTTLAAALLAARQRSAALMEERRKYAAAVETAMNTAAVVARETAVVARKNDVMSTTLQQTAASLDRCRVRERELRATLAAQQQQRQTRVQERLAKRQSSDIAQQALEVELMRDAHRGEMRHLKLRRDFLQRRKFVRDAAKPHSQQAELEALVRELARLKRETEKRKDGAAEALGEAKRRLAESKAVLKRVTEEVAVLRQLPPNEPIPEHYNREMAPTFLPVLLPEGKNEENQGDMAEVNIPPATQVKNEKEKAAAIVVDDDDDDDLDLLVPTTKQQSKQQQQQQPVNTKPTIQFDDDDL